MNTTGGTNFAMTLRFRDNPLYTEVVFLTYDDWVTNDDIVPVNNSLCVADIVDGEAMFYFDAATATLCDITVSMSGGVSNCCDAVDIELYNGYTFLIDTETFRVLYV